MKQCFTFAGLALAMLVTNAASAQMPQSSAGAQAKPTFASVYEHQLAGLEKEIVGAAAAMPDDKFNFAPTGPGEFKGVRTYAMQVKHLATANYMLGAAILQEKPPLDLNGENGPANVTSKADILKYLNDSFAYAHKSVAAINENNILEQVKSPFGDRPTTRLALATSMLAHPFDHYGQMVEYLRMNGIVPPASRK
jgi:DinB superfamily